MNCSTVTFRKAKFDFWSFGGILSLKEDVGSVVKCGIKDPSIKCLHYERQTVLKLIVQDQSQYME